MRKFFGFLFFVGITLILAAMFAPLVWQDMRGRGDWEQATDLTVTKARCKRYIFVISFCDIDYQSHKSNEKEKELSYMVYGGWGGDQTHLVWSASDHQVVTTDLAIRDLKWRIFTFITMIGSMLIVCFKSFLILFRSDDPAGNDAAPATDAATKSQGAMPGSASAQFPQPLGRTGPRIFGKRAQV